MWERSCRYGMRGGCSGWRSQLVSFGVGQRLCFTGAGLVGGWMCEVLRTGGWYVVCKVRSIASLCWFFEMNVTKRLAFINLAVEVAASHVPESDLSDRDLMTSSHLLHNLSHALAIRRIFIMMHYNKPSARKRQSVSILYLNIVRVDTCPISSHCWRRQDHPSSHV
jgi:hypothetical protein